MAFLRCLKAASEVSFHVNASFFSRSVKGPAIDAYPLTKRVYQKVRENLEVLLKIV